MQQVSRTEISFTRTKKLMYKIQEEKKINMQQNSRTKTSSKNSTNNNQHAVSSMNEISFKRRKMYIQFFRTEKSTYNRFCEKNQHETNSTNKNQHATGSMKKIVLEEKNQCTSFTSKQRVP